MKKHALVLFTKSPQPGSTKTRLTERRGGLLSDQEATDLYRAMMLDVASAGFEALDMCRRTAAQDGKGDTFDFIISCSPESVQPVLQGIFEKEFSERKEIHSIVDRGRNFDEHFNDHFRQLFDRGYYSVVCIGGDLPTISPEFIHRAFQWLFYLSATSDRGAMVVAPCQAAGVSLVALTKDAPMDFTGVFYNLQGVAALDAITQIAGQRQIPMTLLEAVSDVDSPEDLAHAMAVINAMIYASSFQPHVSVPRRTVSWVSRMGLVVKTPPNEEHDSRSSLDD